MRVNPRGRAGSLRELSAQLISNAAFVAYEGQKAKEHRLWLSGNDKRQLIYVFDTDLIITWCAPWRNGPVEPLLLRGGYGQVLPQRPFQNVDATEQRNIIARERREAEAVAWLLASRALRAATSRGLPLLQTEAHFEEAISVYSTVKLTAEAMGDISNKEVENRYKFMLSSILQTLAAQLEKHGDNFDTRNAGAVISRILQFIDDRELNRAHGAIREWDAFRDLIRIGNGLFKFSEFSPEDPVIKDVLTSLTGFDTSENEAPFKDLLEKILRAKSRLNLKSATVDISAVAELIELNRRLRTSSTEARVVLLTGDRALVTAMSEATDILPGLDMTVSDFAFAHVRHLWSFVDLNENDLHDGENRPKALFSGLLTFQEESKSDEEFRRELKNYSIDPVSEYIERVGEKEVNDAYERWEGYVKNAADTQKHYLFDSRKEKEITSKILEKLKNGGKTIGRKKLLEMVHETTARARDRANVEFSEIGASSLLDRHKNGVRNPPELMFDSLSITDKIFKDLALPRRVFQKAEDFAKRFAQIKDECYQPSGADDDDYRQECYLKYLVLGALFASANRWIVAEQHAESAVRIVKRANDLGDSIKVGKDGTRISGREAYFLLASSKRIRASTNEDYVNAMDFLVKARKCLQQDRENNAGLGVPFIRFDSEELALWLGRYYTDRRKSCESEGHPSRGTDPCDDLADDVYNAARQLIKKREDMRLADGDATAKKGDQLRNLPVLTRASIATNLIQVFVVSQFREELGYRGSSECPVDRMEMENALDFLIDKTNLVPTLHSDGFSMIARRTSGDPSVVCSPLMLLYAVVGDLLLDSKRLAIFRREVDVNSVFDKYKLSVTKYDEWRFEALRAFAQKRLANFVVPVESTEAVLSSRTVT